MRSKGRTELQISLSRAKNCEEVAGDVRFLRSSSKTSQKLQKKYLFDRFFRMRPNAPERIQMHPNASEQVRGGQSKSEIFKKLAKALKNLRKLRENIAKMFPQFPVSPVYDPVDM